MTLPLAEKRTRKKKKAFSVSSQLMHALFRKPEKVNSAENVSLSYSDFISFFRFHQAGVVVLIPYCYFDSQARGMRV